jgi:hypothetical protein
MKILSEEITYDKITLTDYEQGSGYGSYGSGGCKHQEVFNRKVKTVRLFGIRLISYVIEWEHVPSYVWTSTGALGYDSSNWRSKWAGEATFGSALKYKRPMTFDRPNLSTF